MKKILICLLILTMNSCTQPSTNYSEIEIQPNNYIQKIDLKIEEIIQLEGKVTFKDGTVTSDVLWKSDNDKIATVDSKGYIKGISPGTTNIILSSKVNPEYKTVIQITVSPLKEVNSSDSIKLTQEEQDYINKIFQETENKKLEEQKKDEEKENKYETTNLRINVYDNNNDLVKDITVSAKSLTKEILWSNSYTSETGSLLINDIPNNCLIELSVLKDKWNVKKKTIITKGISKNSNDPLITNFGGVEDSFYAFQFQPEITSVSINSNEIKSINNLNDYISIKQPLRNIAFSFSTQVDKEYFEESFIINSNSDNETGISEYKKDNGLTFIWDRFNRRVEINTNITTKGIYRLSFSKSFKDIENNQALTGRLISFPIQEIYRDYLNIFIEN